MSRRILSAGAAAAFVSLSFVACIGSTGSDLVTFRAAAAGPKDAVNGAPYVFETSAGYTVTLTSAAMQVGAIYLNRNVPLASERETSCILPGTYVAEVRHPAVVNVLSPDFQLLPGAGEGTSDRAATAEIWLGDGDVNRESDPTVILSAKGTAVRNAASFPFEATFTIGKNRAVPPTNSALPGSNPICQQRIITPIAVDITPTNGGTLLLRVNPAAWFNTVDFSTLESDQTPPLYRFPDEMSGQASINLYYALKATSGVYSFEWVP